MAAFYTLAIAFLLVFVQAIDARRSRWNFPTPPASLPTIALGTIFCDRCMDNAFTFNTMAIPNVTAMIDCGGGFRASNTTSQFGVFAIELPAEVAASPARLASCSVRVTSDFSRVDGDLGTCNTPVRLQMHWSSPPSPLVSSPLKAAARGSPWPFYSVGPFFFQPPQALPSCKKIAARPPPPPPQHSAFPGFGFNFPPFFPGANFPPHPKPQDQSSENTVAPPPHSAFPGFGSFPPFFPGAFPPHPNPVAGQDHSSVSNTMAPPHSAFPGFGNFPPFFPGANFPPHPSPHSPGSKYPPFFPGGASASPPHPKDSTTTEAPPPFPGFGFPAPFFPFPGAFPPHPSYSKPPKDESHSAQAPPPFHVGFPFPPFGHGTKKHHRP